VCLDLQQGWIKSANHYLPLPTSACAPRFSSAPALQQPVYLDADHLVFVTSALTFGMGPLIYYYGSEYSIQVMDMFSLMDDRMLCGPNLLNVVGTLMVCIGHFWSTCRMKPKGERVPYEKRCNWPSAYSGAPDHCPAAQMASFSPCTWTCSISSSGIRANDREPAGHLYIACVYIWLSGERKYAWVAILLFVADASSSLLVLASPA